MNEQSIDRTLTKLKLEPTTGDLQAKVDRLRRHFEQVPPDWLLRCDCGEQAPKSLSWCPFCGAVDEQLAKDDEEPAPRKERRGLRPRMQDEEDRAANVQLGDDLLIRETDEERAEIDQLMSELESSTDEDGTTVAIGETSTGIVMVPTPPRDAEEKMLAADNGNMNRVVIGVDPTATTHDLDSCVARIQRNITTSLRANWEIAEALKECHDRGLWRLHPRRYPTEQAFWSGEFKFSSGGCYELLRVARELSREVVEAIGLAKARFIIVAKPENRPKLLAAAHRGVPLIDLQKMRAELEPDKKTKREVRLWVTGAIPVLFPKTRIEALMMCRPSVRGAQNIPATSLEDQPYCNVDFKNGVVAMVRVVRVGLEGKLMMVLEFRERPDVTINPTARKRT